MSEEKDQSQGSLVLVVDDNPANLDLLTRRLIRDGYRVEAREDAVALEADIEALKPDIVLLDWMMPHRSGLEALRGARQLYDSNRLPIIMVTALDESEAVSEAIQAGANDYVSKPIDFTVLKSRLEGALARRNDVLRQDGLASELERLVNERTTELSSANARLVEEISERTKAQELATYAARNDLLTGLPNRLHFLEQLSLLADCTDSVVKSFSLIHIDIDRFRAINQVHGPRIGDDVLVQVAERLRQFTRTNTMVARSAADEFTILVCDPESRDWLSGFARDVRDALSAPIVTAGRSVGITLSLAIVTSLELPCDENVMLLEADAALRKIKREGGDAICFFDEQIDRTIKEAAVVKKALAIGIPRGEIVPHFQPYVDLASGEVVGVEVLARWNHPERGLVSPAVFIPAAEDTGLVDELFWKMLPSAFEAARRAGPNVKISANVSPSQVLDQWFPQKMIRVLQSERFPAQRFEIEITETAVVADMQAAKLSLVLLRNNGVSVALDDFGVGYSSLSLLRELPITKVKIDRSFVSEIHRDMKSNSLVKAIIDLSRTLGLSVTAEGVEEEPIARRLAEWGCEFGQGYWFGRPSANVVLETPWKPKLATRAAA
jgi:diguanylate cyclase (GGDEF)-like protein